MSDVVSEKARVVLASPCIKVVTLGREYRTRDDVHVDYWLSRSRPMGGVINTEAGMKIMGDAFVVYYSPRMQWTSRKRNMALKSIGLYAEEDLLIMKLDRRDEGGSVEIGHLFTADLIEGSKQLIHSRNAVARLVYEKDVYVREANAATSVYYDSLENTVYRGALLGQLHFGMCVMGDILFPTIHNNHWLRLGLTSRDSSGQILFDAQVNTLKGLFLRDRNQNLSSRGWIFEGDGRKQYLMLYADPQVVSRRDANPVTLKKHSSASSRCEVFVLHVEEMEIMPY
ncbi:hypothetical protein ARMSODRAFT_980567 [Armillaria solidipes]|uniref:Uncharacterized protein n=1 Tax=Armillaria solidipes TaxID=1076256 RepID=A0A2H3B1E8_9AGAR|nr:hypothetical protein ARMSODRAFT_980567 [Armillaria solidipes]